MTIETLRGKSQDELKAQLLELKKEAFNLRIQQATGELENTSRMRAVRRDVARINTLLGGGDTAPKAAAKPAAKKEAKKPAAKKAAAKKETKKDDKAA